MAPLRLPFQLASPRANGQHSERRSNLAAGAEQVPITVHRVLLGYALCLAVASGLFLMEEFNTSSLLAGSTSLIVFTCSNLANVGTGAAPKKGEENYMRWMIGIHLGMLIPVLVLLLAVGIGCWTFGILGWALGPSIPFWCLVLTSGVAGYFIFKLRPRKERLGPGGRSGLV